MFIFILKVLMISSLLLTMPFKMMNKIFLILLFTAIPFISIFSQQTISVEKSNDYFNNGKELFKQEKYGLAQDNFQKVCAQETGTDPVILSKAQYYVAICAMRMFNDDAEYFTNLFINKNPDNPLKEYAYFELANYFFTNKIFDKAIEYFSKVDRFELDKNEQAELIFKTGYCYFMNNDFENAKIAFFEIKDKNTKYSAAAIYYYAHIHYELKNYQTALEGFLKLTNDNTFSEIVPYYMTQIYYLQKKYEKVIEYAPDLMEKVTEKRFAEVSRIIGESFFELERYEESLPYFEKYLENVTQISVHDKYRLAYAYYKCNKYDKAVGLLEEISHVQSEIGQSSLYYLANCYLKQNDKQKARMAFSSASQMNYDLKIKEESLFNFALITYEVSYSPFNEAINAFNRYLSEYPNSQKSDKAYQYLVNAYLNTRNYSKALESINKIKTRTPEINKANQKIAYYRGIELYNNLLFDNAVSLFIESQKYGDYDEKLKNLSNYWMGEARYRQERYDMAISNYIEFINGVGTYLLPEFKTAHYNKGYAYFKEKQYDNALTFLKKYIALNQDQRSKILTDALNRTGDCYFIQTNYTSAYEFYYKAILTGNSGADYSMHQAGICLGLLNKNVEKISVLNEMISKYTQSNYTDDALFEIGESYIKLQNSEKALKSFSDLANKYPNSEYRKQALIKLGLINYNNNNSQESLKYYKEVVNSYPNSEEAKNALTGIKNIYVDLNKVNDYVKYVENIDDQVYVSITEKDSLFFISAEKIYMSGNCESAISSFNNYLLNFPNGGFSLNAYFYKGDCHYKQKEYDNALESFKNVLNAGDNIFTEQALLGTCRILFSKKDYSSALDYYKKLELKSSSSGNNLEALIGQLRCYYAIKNNNETVEAGKKILTLDKLPQEIKRETEFKIARSLQNEKRYTEALNIFIELSKEVISKEGAESKFRVAEIYYLQNNYDKSEDVVTNYIEQTTPHEYWIAKSFILWSDIFMKRNDTFQAMQTLQSIIDYYDNSQDGILEAAKEKYEKLKIQKDKKLSSGEEEDIEIQIDN